MNWDIAKIAVDVALLPMLAFVGALVRRSVKQMDTKLDEINGKLDKNIAQTTALDKTVGVHEWRLTQLENKPK